MKYNALYNVSNGCIDIRAFDETNSADDPFYGFGGDWNSAGYFASEDEAFAAAVEEAEAVVSRIIIRRKNSSPANPENYRLIRTTEPVPADWFVKEIVDCLDDGYKIIDNQVRWCEANGIG